VPPAATGVGEGTRDYARGAGVVSVGIAVAGLVSYAYFALASHSLSAADYGRITLLWSAVFITAAIVYRPIEQLVARTIADREARGVRGVGHLRTAAGIELCLMGAFVALAVLFRNPVEDGLFGGSAAIFWTLVAAVVAYAGSYFARGVLAGRRRFALYGLLQVAESCLRIVFPLAVVVGLAQGVTFVALGMAVAPAASLAVILALSARGLPGRGALAGRGFSAWREPRPRSHAAAAAHAGPPPVDAGTPADARPAGAVAAAEPEFTLASGTSYAAGVLLVMASEQTFLNAGPVLVNATVAVEGAALAGFVFNAVLIARAPLQLFQAVQAAILPHLTRLRARGHADPFHRSVTLTLQAIAGFAAAVTLALLAVGPEAMDLLFGGDFDYARGGLALMGLGMGLYLAAATLTQAALARGQAERASVRWLLAAVAFVALLLAPTFDDRVLRVELAFLGGALVLFASLLVLYVRGERAEA
jgi:O-antigen/teichoic acid export membrane protein